MALSTTERPVVHTLLDRLLEARQPLLALDTTDTQAVVAGLRMQAASNGTAVYLWRPACGIVSLCQASIELPGTRRVGDALRYAERSVHSGIYVFCDAWSALEPSDVIWLRRLRSAPHAIRTTLVFVGTADEVPVDLVASLGHIGIGAPVPPRLRLRDGHWLQ